MALLRSTRFYGAIPPAPASGSLWTVAYTVPAGHVIVLKNVVTSNGGASAKIGGTRQEAALLIRQVTLAAGASDTFSPWIVIDAGGQLSVLQQAGGSINYFLSGSLLFV